MESTIKIGGKSMIDIGLQWEDLERFIREQIFTLPGISNHEEKLSVLLTGSRAMNAYSKGSDVDLDVVCSREVFEDIQKEMQCRGLTPSKEQAFYYLPAEGWEKYFGQEVGRPHFSIIPLEIIENQINKYEDIPIWIWTNAVIINDPRSQFKNIINNFKRYPQEVLRNKIKYRYLLSFYWLIDGYPHHHQKRNEEMFMASLAILNGVHELYRLFYLMDGKPYPYSEKLPLYINTTKLGKKFKPFLDGIINMVLGYGHENADIWERFDKAIEAMLYDDISLEARELSEECDKTMIELGIEEPWVRSGYDNIDELLQGKLGPIPF